MSEVAFPDDGTTRFKGDSRPVQIFISVLTELFCTVILSAHLGISGPYSDIPR